MIMTLHNPPPHDKAEHEPSPSVEAYAGYFGIVLRARFGAQGSLVHEREQTTRATLFPFLSFG